MTITRAPSIGALESRSLTTPLIDPVVACARATLARANTPGSNPYSLLRQRQLSFILAPFEGGTIRKAM
jgi:hypothetical protein